MAYDDSGTPALAGVVNDEELQTYRELATGVDDEPPLPAAVDRWTGF